MTEAVIVVERDESHWDTLRPFVVRHSAYGVYGTFPTRNAAFVYASRVARQYDLEMEIVY